MDLEASQQQRPPTRRPSARHRRAMSAIARPNTASLRPGTASGRPRRPYSAYTKRGAEETTPKYDAPESNREWWRYCVKVNLDSVECSTKVQQVNLPQLIDQGQSYYCLAAQAITYVGPAKGKAT